MGPTTQPDCHTPLPYSVVAGRFPSGLRDRVPVPEVLQSARGFKSPPPRLLRPKVRGEGARKPPPHPAVLQRTPSIPRAAFRPEQSPLAKVSGPPYTGR